MIQNLRICHIRKRSDENAGLPPGFLLGTDSTGTDAIGSDSTGSDSAAKDLVEQQEWLLFETCQRRIYISCDTANAINGAANRAFNSANTLAEADLIPGATMHTAEGAYAKLLSILCGLESKILGETEVFGQFKIFAATLNANDRFRRIAQDLILDVRELRKTCLSNVGLRSYGSLSSFYVKNLNSIAVFGGGQLAQKILPYLIEDKHQVSLYLRDPAKIGEMPERMVKNLDVFPMFEAVNNTPLQGVIIAAPIASKQIQNWLQSLPAQPEIIVDLRDQTSDTKLDFTGKLVTLDELFEQMEKTSSLMMKKVKKAKSEVFTLTDRRFSTRRFRPFGWEDICA